MRVFISFASKDRETVRRLDTALRRRRPEISCFLDERGLTGGVYWIPRLGEELGKADVVLLLLGESIGRWQELEYYEALQLSRRSGGRPRIVPVVIADRPAPGLAFLSTLHQIVALDPTSAPALSAIVNALNSISTAKVAEAWRRFHPYTGLPALTERDAAFFFGRDKETADVLRVLSRARGRIVTLIGQSGVGKSSLVLAGVLSRLKSQLWPIEDEAWPGELKDSRSYQQLTMRPGSDPVKELAVSFVRLYRNDDAEIEKEASGWTARFREGSRLRDMLRLTRDKIAEQQGGTPPKRFILYVDQGEELYTRAPKEEAKLFSKLLANAAGEWDTFSVLMSLRSDFYPDFQNDESIFGLSEKYDVLPLTHGLLIDVIRKPAEVLGASFEDAHMPPLIAEATQREPGALPLLSDLLQEMWLSMLSRGDGVLRWSDQPGIVDIGLPLKRRADAFLDLPTTDLNVVRRLFTLHLAQVTQVGEPVRRQARKSECRLEEWSVAEQLAAADQRLLMISNPLLGGEPIVEVAHEQLLASWPALKGWLEEQREFLIWRTEAEQAAKDYRRLPDEKKSEAVLMGLRLTTAESWFDQRADDLPLELRDYIKASMNRRDEIINRQKQEDAQKLATEKRLKEAELERERLGRMAAEKAQDLQRERADAAEQKAVGAREREAAARKLSNVSLAAAIVLLILTGAAIFGFWSARQATQAAVENYRLALEQATGSLELLEDGYRQGQIRTQLMRSLVDRGEKTVASFPDERDEITVARTRLFDVLSLANIAIGNVDDARKFVDLENTLADRLKGKDESNSTWSELWAIARSRRAAQSFWQGDYAAAISQGRSATDELVKISSANLSDEYFEQSLIDAFENLGDAFRAEGNLAEAGKAYANCLGIEENLIAHQPGKQRWLTAEAFTHQRIGDSLLVQGNPGEALNHYKKYASLAAELAQKDPGKALTLEALAVSNEKLGDALVASSQLDDALVKYQTKLKWAKELAVLEPTNYHWNFVLETSYERIGEVQLQTHEYKSALDAFREYQTLADVMLKRNPSHNGAIYDAANAHEKVGDALYRQNELDAAMAEYQATLKMSLQLAEKSSANPAWQKLLAMSYQRIGMTLRSQLDLRGAQVAFERCTAVPVNPSAWSPRTLWPPNVTEYCRQSIAELTSGVQ